MELDLEGIVAVGIGISIGLTLSRYLIPKVSEPYRNAHIEYVISPKGKTYRQLVKEHKAILNDPDYKEQFANRLLPGKQDNNFPID